MKLDNPLQKEVQFLPNSCYFDRNRLSGVWFQGCSSTRTCCNPPSSSYIGTGFGSPFHSLTDDVFCHSANADDPLKSV